MHSINGHEDGRQVQLYDEATGGDIPGRLEYYHKDHLGNVRLTFSDINQDGAISVGRIYDPNNEIVLEKHYYPFGLDMTGAWFATVAPDNAYRYNGKELDEATGHYFYGARMYDPAIARFTGVDPIADQFAWVSPYNYAENEPIRHIDLHGLQKALPSELVDIGNRIESRVQSFFDYMAPSKETQLFLKGAKNTSLGIGATIGGAYLSGSSGGLAAYAGGTVMTMGLTEASIGLGQMVDAAFGSGDENSILHKSTSGFGLLAYSQDSEYAPLLDVTGEVLPSLMTGGLTGASGLDDLMGGVGQLRNLQLLKGSFSIFQANDANGDLRGLVSEARKVISNPKAPSASPSQQTLTESEISDIENFINKLPDGKL
ncbi:MAG: RHS repeat-associated core domain-containing protein [Bacteroidota bacterium]